MTQYLLTNTVIATELWKALETNASYSQGLTTLARVGVNVAGTYFKYRPGVQVTAASDFPAIGNAKSGWRVNDSPFTGTFANAVWIFNVALYNVKKYGHAVKIAARLSRSANSDGSTATIIGAVTESPNTITLAGAAGDIKTDSWTYNPGAITMISEYLFVEFRLVVVTPGSNSTTENAFLNDEDPATRVEAVTTPALTITGTPVALQAHFKIRNSSFSALQTHFVVSLPGSSDLQAHFIIRSSDTSALQARLQVRHSDLSDLQAYLKIRKSDSSALQTHFIISLSGSSDLQVHFTVRRSGASDLQSHLLARHSGLSELQSSFYVLTTKTGTPQSLQAHLLIRRSDASDLQSGFIISAGLFSDAADLRTQFTIRKSDTSALQTHLQVRHSDFSDLQAHIIIRHGDSAEILAHIIIRNLSSDDLQAGLIIRKSDISDLQAHFIVVLPGSSDLQSGFYVLTTKTGTPQNLQAHFTITGGIDSEDLFAKFKISKAKPLLPYCKATKGPKCDAHRALFGW